MANPIKFFDYPRYNESLESENMLINISEIQAVKHHANVPVDPGAVSTTCVEIFYKFGTSDIILLDYDTVKTGIEAYYGVVNGDGTMT